MAGFKKSTVESAPDISILGDSVTLLPSGYTESSARRDADNSRELVGTMARFRSSPLDFFREVSLHVNGTGWRAYDKYLGQPVFFPGFTEKMRGRILGSHMIQNKIIELARIRVKKEGDEGLLVEKSEEGREKRRVELENSLLEVAGKMVDEMICKMESKSFIRFAYYFITQLLTRAYHQGIHVSSEEILRLREVAAKAAEKKQSIIFLPSHRSHVDYVSLQILCYRLGLTLPVVVAGDNLNFPVVGPFLQNAGAMWIRRSFGDDQLYSSVVQSYVDTLLQNGYNFECFIEGGRSRTGKLLGPKFGILRFLCESLWSGRVEDAIVCPVSCQYDKVIEVDSYISELLGTPKKKENFADFFTGGASILNLKLGRIDVRFHQPWSLREFLTDQFIKATKLPQQMATPDGWTNDLKNRALKVMGYQVLEHINDVSVVMPTALVGTILLTLRGRGVGKSELIRRVDWLCDRVRDKGGRVAHFANLKTGVVVERALEVLGPSMVGRVQNLPEDTFFAVDRFQLSFYRNMTIHLFILEALVCAGMYTRVKVGGGPESQIMTYAELHKQVAFLSQLFRGEFIFPTEGLEHNLHTATQRLESDKVLKINREADQITSIELTPEELHSGRENFDFYCFLIWPFIEASWLGAVSLMMLAPPDGSAEADRWLDIKKVDNRAQLLGKTLYHQGDLSYFEAVNKETLKNAYSRFIEEGIIIVRRSRDAKKSASLMLADEWMPKRDPVTKQLLPQGQLWEFAEAISQTRREGKNRRDGNWVQHRVLALVDVVGDELWKEKAREKDPSLKEREQDLKSRRTSRRRAMKPTAKL